MSRWDLDRGQQKGVEGDLGTFQSIMEAINSLPWKTSKNYLHVFSGVQRPVPRCYREELLEFLRGKSWLLQRYRMKRKVVRHQRGKEGAAPAAETLMIQQCILGSFQLTRLGVIISQILSVRSGINKLRTLISPSHPILRNMFQWKECQGHIHIRRRESWDDRCPLRLAFPSSAWWENSLLSKVVNPHLWNI